jgi:hypothetical protein
MVEEKKNTETVKQNKKNLDAVFFFNDLGVWGTFTHRSQN